MKKLLALTLALVLCLGLAACGGGTSTDTDTNADTSSDADTNGDATANGETITLTVGATPNPHAEILAQVKDDLAAEGIDLVVKEYSDYVVPNTAVEEGDLDANYFQHTPYMEKFNEENGTHLVSVGKIHYEPMGIYPGLTKTLEELPDGATIAVPNDATNEARALQLLAAQGLIELKEDAGLNATPNDITSNPKNLQFKELEAAMLPQTASEVDLSVINSNFAMEGGMNPATDSLASEDADSEAAQTFANIIAVKEASGKMDQIATIAAAAPEGFSVYSGDDSATYDIMRLGGVGVISTTGNVAPERMKELVTKCAEGKWDEAWAAHEALLPLMNGLFETSNPILVKEALSLVGFPVGGVRLPLVDATPEQSARLASIMREVGVLD